MTPETIDRRSLLRFVGCSAIGIAAFFIPVTFAGRSTIVPDHLVTLITTHTPLVGIFFATGLIFWGGLRPFLTKEWNNSASALFLSLTALLAMPIAIVYLGARGLAGLEIPEFIPFLFERLAVPVGLIIPIGAVLLTFLVDFGLLEAVGALMERIMKPVFKTPGRSAVDAMASFVGSYSVGLLITDSVYKSGRYSAREAAIIATGFSTVSATFMLIVAKTLVLTEIWLAYFFATLTVTFSVTAITVRLPPIANMSDEREDPGNPPQNVSFLKNALRSGLEASASASSLGTLLARNFANGMRMASRVVPSILAMGSMGLVAANYTPVFDILGYALAPVVWLFSPNDAHEIGTVLASGLAEMFLPAVQSAEFELTSRFAVGVVSVSSILFLSASIPCILATSIPLTLTQMIFVWALRTVLSIPLAYAAAWMLGIA